MPSVLITIFLLFWSPIEAKDPPSVPVKASAKLFGFDEGLRPLKLTLPSKWRAADCGECHVSAYKSWQNSRHNHSWSNNLLQEGFVREPQSPCVNCHAPLAEQAAEVKSNLAWYLARGQLRHDEAEVIKYQPETLAAEGITCVVCHVRGGMVLSSSPDEHSPHPVQQIDEYSGPELCKGCHEFHFPVIENGRFMAGKVAAQSTITEWERWRAEGGKESCVDCHMPNGSHAFPGAHDRKMLAESINVNIRQQNQQVVFQLSANNVGHHLPTGDIL